MRRRPSTQAYAAPVVTRPRGLNADLIRSERLLTDERGLPNRPWFEHLLYAPGFYTGYGVKTIPGVREAIEQKKWSEADEQIARLRRAGTRGRLTEAGNAVIARKEGGATPPGN
jgi:N-acetylated-alpha-linked acidic dipeptidase